MKAEHLVNAIRVACDQIKYMNMVGIDAVREFADRLINAIKEEMSKPDDIPEGNYPTPDEAAAYVAQQILEIEDERILNKLRNLVMDDPRLKMLVQKLRDEKGIVATWHESLKDGGDRFNARWEFTYLKAQE